MAGQVPQVFAHLGGPGGAVQPDHVDAQRFDGRQRRADLAAQQHGAGRFDGDMGENRDVTAGLGHRPARPQHRRLELQQVLAGLDEDRVGAAIQHPECSLRVRITDHRVLGVASVGSLVPGPIDPSTYRLRSAVVISSATRRAIAVAFCDSSRILSAMS